MPPKAGCFEGSPPPPLSLTRRPKQAFGWLMLDASCLLEATKDVELYALSTVREGSRKVCVFLAKYTPHLVSVITVSTYTDIV